MFFIHPVVFSPFWIGLRMWESRGPWVRSTFQHVDCIPLESRVRDLFDEGQKQSMLKAFSIEVIVFEP